MLNDHWFKDNHIYVLSPKLNIQGNNNQGNNIHESNNYSIVALGKNIPSKDENNKIEKLRSLIPQLNTENRNNKDTKSNLYITIRFSNIYKINNINIEEQYKLLEEYLYSMK